MGIDNFNKLIDIQFYKKGFKGFEITSPTKGRKPDIEISGTYTPANNVNEFYIKIKNLYTSKPLSDYDTIYVYAGYENNKNAAIIGQYVTTYNESPAPDKVTVFKCTTANYLDFINTYVNLNISKGTTLSSILATLSSSAGYNTPRLTASASTKTLKTDWPFSGTVSNAIAQLQQEYFNDVQFMPDNNCIYARTTSDNITTKTINYLSSPPQVAGDIITFVAPWDPTLRPSDLVKLNTSYFKHDMSFTASSINTIYEVDTISFAFGTVSNKNTMTVIASTKSS